tara:strand:+ start:362 stop:568 length:207 start_codon:yes stop_codon:yes gene_type:complete
MESNEDFKHLNLLSIKQVCELLNRDRKTIWEWVRDGQFINPIKVNGRTLGFLETDYEQWLQNKANEIS